MISINPALFLQFFSRMRNTVNIILEDPLSPSKGDADCRLSPDVCQTVLVTANKKLKKIYSLNSLETT